MPDIKWFGAQLAKEILSKGLDGIEEWCNAEWLPQAKQDCPVDSGTMRNSLGVERSNSENACYIGGGGMSEDYIMKQELDRSLSHPVGKAGFITDTYNAKVGKIATYIQKHL